MPSWKKLIVSGSDARVATLFTSGHLTASGNISGSLSGSLQHLVVDDVIQGTSSLSLTSSLSQELDFDTVGHASGIYHNLLLGKTGDLTANTTNDRTEINIAAEDQKLSYNAYSRILKIGDGGTDGLVNARATHANNIKFTAVSQSFENDSNGLVRENHFYKIPFADTGTNNLNNEAFTDTELEINYKQMFLGMNKTGFMWSPSNQHLSASTTSTASFGTYFGDGGNLTGIDPGIFIETGSFYATTNNLQLTGSIDISANITASNGTIGNLNITGMSVPNIVSVSSSLSSRTLNLESTSSLLVGNGTIQSVGTTSVPQFAGISIGGDSSITGSLIVSEDLIAKRLIISSSVSVITQSFSAGNTIFGDTLDDTHEFTGSFNITGSMISNGLPVISSSAQIAVDISGSFTQLSQSIKTSRNAYSQSISARLGSVEAGNIGDGSMSGTNTGDVTLNTASHDFLSISGQQISLGPIDLATDTTGTISGSQFGTAARTAISGAFATASSSFSTRVSLNETTSSKLDLASGSFSSRIGSLEGASAGIFVATGSSFSTTNDLQITGSLAFSGSQQSTSIRAQNIQNGYPTSNNWGENLDGSYFNNFTNETHVSEILRFIAGAMSHSLDIADAAPNTKLINGVSTSYVGTSTTSKNSLLNGVLGSSYQSAKLSMHWTSSAAINYSLTQSYRDVQSYLITKGFMVAGDKGTFGNDTGTNPFTDNYGTNIPSTISTNGDFDNFGLTVTSTTTGTTSVRSSADNNLFGMGTLSSGNANAYVVRVIASQSFSDTQTDTTPDASSTFHKKEVVNYTQNSFGTSNGLTLAKINTSQPAVIPAAFQDGKFASVVGPITGRFYTGGSQDENNISASGYYKMHDVKVGIQSGSGNFNFFNGSDSSTFFYLYTGGLPTDITTSVPSAVVSNPTLVRTGLSVVYKSLSGCPYIQSVQYNNTFSSEANNLFEPAYDSVTVLQHDISTNEWDSIDSSQTITPVAVATDSNGVDTSVANSRGVLSADKSTLRADGDIPHRTDIAFLSSSISMSIAIDSGISTTVQTKSAQAALTYTNTFRSRGRNWKNTVTSNTATTLAFYNAALFTANSVTNLGSKVFTNDSGSMAIHAFQQGYDNGSLTGTTEQFTGEDFRIQLNNNVVSFSGDAFIQTFNINRNPSVIGDYDLQVKPGFLVDPGSTNGYWFPNGYGSGTYKYYIRRFQTSGTKTNLTVNVGYTLQAWNSTNNGISVAILFESSADTNYSRARIYDPTATSDNDIETNISSDNHKNPFTDAIDLYGNTGGSLSSTTYTMPLRNIDGMTLDNTNNEYYLIIRYKGNPSPVTQITVGYS